MYNPPVPSLHIIYASTSGHTEYVIDEVIETLRASGAAVDIEKQRVETAQAEDLARGEVLVLACGTWNTGGSEGQLNPHMFAFLRDRAKKADLGGKPVFCIGLGDQRYHFTGRALLHLEDYVSSHNNTLLSPSLKIVNEPYGQEARVHHWTKHLLSSVEPEPDSRTR